MKRAAEDPIAEITERIATLERMREVLKELTRACSGQGGTSECSNFDALDQEVAQ